MSDSPVGPEDIRAAAEVYRELGPDYQSAIVASFIQKVDQEVEARVQARLAAGAPAPARRPRRQRRRARDLVAAAAGGALVLAGVAGVAVTHHSVAHHSGAAARVSLVRPGLVKYEAVLMPSGKHVVLSTPGQ